MEITYTTLSHPIYKISDEKRDYMIRCGWEITTKKIYEGKEIGLFKHIHSFWIWL